MDTPFENIDDDTREDWSRHPATVALSRTLSEQLVRLRENIVRSAGSPKALETNAIGIMGGECIGLEFALGLVLTPGKGGNT